MGPQAGERRKNVPAVLPGPSGCPAGTIDADQRGRHHHGLRWALAEAGPRSLAILLEDVAHVHPGGRAAAHEGGPHHQAAVHFQHGVDAVQAFYWGEAAETGKILSEE